MPARRSQPERPFLDAGIVIDGAYSRHEEASHTD